MLRALEREQVAVVSAPHFERAPDAAVAAQAAQHVEAPHVDPAILNVMNVMRTADQD